MSADTNAVTRDAVAEHEAANPAANVTALIPQTLGGTFRSYVRGVRSGETGSVPAVVGALVLMVIFGVAQGNFLSSSNIVAIVQQSAPTTIMAMGLVFVLLLGEIDLSAGVVGSTAAAFGAVLSVKHGMPWYVAILGSAVFGGVVGLFLGWLRAKLNIPSFVVTLSAFIAFQGVQILVINSKSNGVQVSDQTLHDLYFGRISPAAGWILLFAALALYVLVKVVQNAARRRKGLAVVPVTVLGLRALAIAVFGGGFVYLMNIDQSVAWQQREGIHQWGVPWSSVIILGLLVVLGFTLTKTRYGRHVFAVGGNEEAARRAGIRVLSIRTSVFVLCSALAALSGLILAGQLGGVSTGDGAGNTLLLAVAAAVIGGTSLMGGRGRIVDAILGGVVLAILQNGISDLLQGNNASAYELIIEGAVLLLAAAVDSVSRRTRR
ncbi:MAG TPA: ABC transporter permease [Actinospica sp.]|nr:ABC transporter permease [Actinospica sp.]